MQRNSRLDPERRPTPGSPRSPVGHQLLAAALPSTASLRLPAPMASLIDHDSGRASGPRRPCQSGSTLTRERRNPVRWNVQRWFPADPRCVSIWITGTIVDRRLSSAFEPAETVISYTPPGRFPGRSTFDTHCRSVRTSAPPTYSPLNRNIARSPGVSSAALIRMFLPGWA